MFRNVHSHPLRPRKADATCKAAQSYSIQEAHQKNGVDNTAISRLKGSPKTGKQDKAADANRKRPKKKRRKTGPAA